MESATPAVLSAAATPTASLYAASSWSNITAHALNISSTYFRVTSAKDLVHLPFRIAHDLDHAVFRSLPRYLLQATGLISIAAENNNIAAPAVNAAAEAVGQANTGAALSWTDIIAEAFSASTFKSYFGMLQYLTSRWAFTCFAVALILNRVQVYGSSRQRIFLSWYMRLALRLIPIMLFIPQIYRLLSAIQCQTSPDYSLYRHGDNNKYTMLDWSRDGGSLYTLTTKALYWQTDAQACSAVGMSRPEPDVRAPYGSFSLLWPTFLRLAMSHMVESMSCSLQQLPLMTEVGMSVFEHSLAFAEAENMITSTLTLLAKEARNASRATQTATVTPTPTPTPKGMVMASGTVMALSDALSSLTRTHILDRINVPVEVLIVALLSAGNALSSNIVAVLGKQHKWRLINTAIWGCLFMGSFIWGFATSSIMSRADEDDPRPVTSLLHFPTVAIIGFLPHFIILVGMVVCFWIYVVALTLTALSLGTNPNIPRPSSLKQRFSIAHENLTAAMQLRAIRPKWSEDFYTALLRIGFSALTAASEAVFLNEGRSVEMRHFTWLEEERLDYLELSRSKDTQMSSFQILEEYGIPSSTPGGLDKGGVWESGYAKERKFDKKEGDLSGKDSFAYPTPRQDGVGAMQRSARFYLLFIYIRGILFLLAGWAAYLTGAILDKIGITSRPRWLRRIVGRSLKDASKGRGRLDGDMMGPDGWQGQPPDDLATDVETEMLRSLRGNFEAEEAEAVLDDRMYQWWKDGGWFGTQDRSGSYQPTIVDEDITSVVSMSTADSAASEAADEEWEDEPAGARTPTQTTPNPGRQTWSFSAVDVRTRESTPAESTIDTPLDPATLARLLNPQDKASREEARILASHLAPSTNPSNPNRIMTRSQYRLDSEREAARVLLAGRLPPSRTTPATILSVPLYNPTSPTGPQPLTRDEEAEVLESLLLARRSKLSSTATHERRDNAPADDGAGAGSGVLCVVCQTTPRTIIAWPCRCLCVCEDCRVSLAMNNFGNCVTCRRTVGGFVRLWVP